MREIFGTCLKAVTRLLSTIEDRVIARGCLTIVKKMKRKAVSSPSEKASKNAKDNNGDVKPKSKENNAKMSLNFESPEQLLTSMLNGMPLTEFLAEYWEKKPLHIKRNNDKCYGDLFTLDSLYSILSENEIMYETDINVCRYVDGVKEMLNSDGQASSEDIKTLFNDEGATLQFHHPQRFSKDLWHFLEKLETYFGSLVGSNVYITPPKCKGLAPHHDDVEVFILQLEGSKKWKLYEPTLKLPRTYSEDLLEKDIGEPTHEIVLEKGDLLYFPRGTIHAAEALDDHSTHITISTYQNNTWGDLLLTTLSNAIENAMENQLEFRQGLPIKLGSFMGLSKKENPFPEEGKETNGTNGSKSSKELTDFNATLKDLMKKLIDFVDPHTSVDDFLGDFVASRLPPTDDNEVDDTDDAPSTKSHVQLRHPEHVRVVLEREDEDETSDEEEIEDDEDMDDDDMETENKEDEEVKSLKDKKEEKAPSDEKPARGMKTRRKGRSKSKSMSPKRSPSNGQKQKLEQDMNDDDEEDEEFCIVEGPCVRIIHSIGNEQSEHMVGEEKEPAGIRFPLRFGKALIHLHDKSDEFTTVKDLPLDEEDQLHLVTTLWSESLINVKEDEK